MKISQEEGSKANIGFRHAMTPSYIGMHPPKATFSAFRPSPQSFQATVF